MGGNWSRKEGMYVTLVPWNPFPPSSVWISGPIPHTTKYSKIRPISRRRGETGDGFRSSARLIAAGDGAYAGMRVKGRRKWEKTTTGSVALFLFVVPGPDRWIFILISNSGRIELECI